MAYIPNAHQISNHKQRQDSVYDHTQHKPSTLQLLQNAKLQDLQRERQLRFILEESKRQAERQPTKEEKMTLQNVMIPVLVRIEHCAYLKTPVNGRQTGKTFRTVSSRSLVQTLHAPLERINATSFAETRLAMRQVYDTEFGRSHAHHLHSDTRYDGLIMELYVRLDQTRTEIKVTESNWSSILGMLAVNHLPAIQNGRPDACVSTLVARFTCPMVGKA